MESEDKDDPRTLLADWRKETIHWGSIYVEIMDKREGLDTEEKFHHLAIDRIVGDLVKEAGGDSKYLTPEEVIALIERDDQVEMKFEAGEAIKKFRKANEMRAWFKNVIRRKEFSALST